MEKNNKKTNQKGNQFGVVLEDVNSKLGLTLDLMRMSIEINSLRQEIGKNPDLADAFEKRLKNIEKDFIACKKALALR